MYTFWEIDVSSRQAFSPWASDLPAVISAVDARTFGFTGAMVRRNCLWAYSNVIWEPILTPFRKPI